MATRENLNESFSQDDPSFKKYTNSVLNHTKRKLEDIFGYSICGGKALEKKSPNFFTKSNDSKIYVVNTLS